MNESRRASARLTHCDREPIHIPGAVQPHGVLLALRESDLTVTQASANAEHFLGADASRLPGCSLSELLPAESWAAVEAAVGSDTPSEVNPLRLTVGGRACDGVLHRYAGVVILEIEPRRETGGVERSHHPLRRVVSTLGAATTLQELLEAGADAVRRLTGFERVMTYSFDEDGHGRVDAEVRSEGLESYLGQHYPASDIPRQARELYLRSAIRNIPDARYTPVALVPPLRPDTGSPLDLTHAFLRSVSPVHLEYLANMGIRASMSLSLVVRDRLWGLVSCAHHSGPHYLPYEVRSDCEVVARVMSLLIGAFEDREAEHARQARRPTLDVLGAAMRGAEEPLSALLNKPSELFTLLGIHGAVVVSDDVRAAGHVPPPAAVRALADWLTTQEHPAVFVTGSLSALSEDFTAIKDVASGIVSFALPGALPRRFIGFRPEILHTVNWGGDPRKPVVEDATRRIHPRRSFALWREEVRLRSHPWTPADREAADELRRIAVEADLERQVYRAHQAVTARNDLIAVVSHDLKNPLNVLQLQSVLLRHLTGGDLDERSARLRAALDRIQRSVGHMDALVHDLLDLARIEAGRFVLQTRAEPVNAIVEEALMLLRPLAEAKGLDMQDHTETDATVLADRERIFQVLSNLVGNAIKFTPAGGHIEVRTSMDERSALVEVSDNGPGLAPDKMTEVFTRYWQASATGRQGVGLGLFIAKSIVEAHGGRIWAEPGEAQGAVFKFTLPLATGTRTEG